MNRKQQVQLIIDRVDVTEFWRKVREISQEETMTLNPRQRVHFGPRPTVTDRQWKLIGAIADRAIALFPDRDRRDVLMDVTCVHATICPLRLDDLFTADDINFIHDIVGIERHLDRSAFELKDCFVPRFAERPIK